MARGQPTPTRCGSATSAPVSTSCHRREYSKFTVHSSIFSPETTHSTTEREGSKARLVSNQDCMLLWCEQCIFDEGILMEQPFCFASSRWTTPAVEYVKAKLYPLYKQGNGKLTKERFKAIVKQVLDLFKAEANSLQSELVQSNGELASITKTRLKTLIDRVYKASSSGSPTSSRATSAAAPSSPYSALPPTKHRRIA